MGYPSCKTAHLGEGALDLFIVRICPADFTLAAPGIGTNAWKVESSELKNGKIWSPELTFSAAFKPIRATFKLVGRKCVIPERRIDLN